MLSCVRLVSGNGLCGLACLRHDILCATAASDVATAAVQISFPGGLQDEDIASSCTVPFLLDPVHVLSQSMRTSSHIRRLCTHFVVGFVIGTATCVARACQPVPGSSTAMARVHSACQNSGFH